MACPRSLDPAVGRSWIISVNFFRHFDSSHLFLILPVFMIEMLCNLVTEKFDDDRRM